MQVLSRAPTHYMGHEKQDAISLELGRRVAARLREVPELLSVARENLARWSRLNADAPSLLRCYEEWKTILHRPLAEICELLCADTEESQRLRQNSPSAGILSPREVWEIKSTLRQNEATST
jgi:hypothetical protein